MAKTPNHHERKEEAEFQKQVQETKCLGPLSIIGAVLGNPPTSH